MKGLYITEEGKKELEATLNELDRTWNKTEQMWGKIFTLREILSSAIVLPVEESWDDVFNGRNKYYPVEVCQITYTNGVIIQPKS